jgi:uncharacterized membrane protein YoaK (UPF0700 family)
MIPPFPRWIWWWAILLPAVAGSVNAAALLSLSHGGVTHLTGISTEAGIGLGSGNVALLAHAAGVVALFTGGCALSAWVARGPRWIPSLSATLLLLLVSGLLVLASPKLDTTPWLGIMICAAAMGVQNGTTSVVSGAVLRTSHLTGMFTDLGIALGQRARSGVVDYRRVGICIVVIGSFVIGAVLGTIVFDRWQARSLLGSAVLASAAAAWTFLSHVRLRK